VGGAVVLWVVRRAGFIRIAGAFGILVRVLGRVYSLRIVGAIS
jgi:hypothetical protein